MVFRGDGALTEMRRVFARYLEAIDANWDAVDPDKLHDLRVALRRTRALLASAKGVIAPADRARFAAGFGTLARATTAARDLDVLVADWPELAGSEALTRRRDAAHAEVASALQSAATRALMDEWRRWLAASVDVGGPRARQRVRKVVHRRANKTRKRLVRLAKIDTPEARHAWRKQAKRLRYLAEAFPDSFRRRLVPALTEAQDALGRERDRLVQAAILEDIGESTLADTLRRRAAPPDRRKRLSRSLKRWIRAA